MNKELIKRIEKLLSLANSQNENEAKIAMLKAQKLMIENGICMNNIKKTEIEIEEHLFKDISWSSGSWKIKLLMVICKNFRCKSYIYPKGRKKYPLIFGAKEDIEIVKAIYPYACDVVDYNINQIKQLYKRMNQSIRGIEESYGTGFTEGLKQRFYEQKKEHQEWGLILKVPEEEIKKYIEGSKYNDRGKQRRTSIKINDSIYDKGKEHGRNFTTHKGIE